MFFRPHLLCYSIREQATALQMEDMIQSRQEQINNIHNLMKDLNVMTADIAHQTQIQGGKLGQIDDEMA